MEQYAEEFCTECGCVPFPAYAQASSCSTCDQHDYVTHEEHAILTRMRALKKEVRFISLRLRDIEAGLGDHGATGSFEEPAEWGELGRRLESLRGEWREWERKLDDAIENKLIRLGHRQPKANA